MSFGRDTKSRWSLLSGVYARRTKISHTGGKCVTCSGLTNSRKEQLLKTNDNSGQQAGRGHLMKKKKEEKEEGERERNR